MNKKITVTFTGVYPEREMHIRQHILHHLGRMGSIEMKVEDDDPPKPKAKPKAKPPEPKEKKDAERSSASRARFGRREKAPS